MMETKQLNNGRAKRDSGERQTASERNSDNVPEQGGEIVDVVQDVIRKYPAVSLGIAVAAGLAIGWMVKRR